MEDSAEGDVNAGAPAQELSEGKVISKWLRDHPCEPSLQPCAFLFLIKTQWNSLRQSSLDP